MADIELVIKIPEEIRIALINNIQLSLDQQSICDSCIKQAITNGTPLPKGHGKLIDKDHMIARLEAASRFFGGENTDTFDERFSHGLKESAIKVDEEPTIIEADKTESEENINYNKKMNYQGIVAGLLLALDIMDKYSTESEDKNADSN